MKSLTDQPWWSAADRSEMRLLVHEFVRTWSIHRSDCGVCSAGGPWCPVLVGAFEAITTWRDRRRLESEAAWLRARQDLAEFAQRLSVV